MLDILQGHLNYYFILPDDKGDKNSKWLTIWFNEVQYMDNKLITEFI